MKMMTFGGNAKTSLVFRGMFVSLNMEMERDCVIGHGSAGFLIDRLMDNSDRHSTQVCNVCGMFAVHNVATKERYCTSCKTSEITNIQIPYATVLLFTELYAMGITPRLLVNKKEE